MKYTGKLAKRIQPIRIGLLATGEHVNKEVARVVDEKFSKLRDLCAAHEVRDGDWLSLSLRLAETHVPGFQFGSTRGRKASWTALDKAEFQIDVDEFREQTGLDIKEAIKQVIRKERWKELGTPSTLATMEQYYHKADPRWIEVVKKARAYELIAAYK